MGIFNYIDTFFFISLGITFILILLLVFHFKQRVADLEEKNATMFEIINNIVKEVSSVKENCCLVNTIRPYEEKIPVDFCCLPTISKPKTEKIVVSDAESDDDYSECADDESLYSDDEDSEERDEDSGENVPELLNILDDANLEENSIKIINVEITESIDIFESENVSENNDEDRIEEVVNLADTEEIQIEKLESDNNQESLVLEGNALDSQSVEMSKDIYRKMTLQALKTLVITKGLHTDPSKMKKNELLKLLETNED
jgi:hypothetical protein